MVNQTAIALPEVEILRMREAAERMRRLISHYMHGEDCDRSGHENCGETSGGVYFCENGDSREECEACRCDCGVDGLKRLALEILGGTQGDPYIAWRVDAFREVRKALRELVRLDQARAEGNAAEYVDKIDQAWSAARVALEVDSNPPAPDEAVSQPEPLTPIDLAALNPGIRTLVERLRAAGFDTRDSGDGVTRQFECDPGFPYVHIVLANPFSMIAEAQRLEAWLVAAGVQLQELDEEGAVAAVEAHYCPVSGTASLSIFNVTDASLSGGAADPSHG